MGISASVTYKLSEAGRRMSLANGGDGKELQTVYGEIDPKDLWLFDVDKEGRASVGLLMKSGNYGSNDAPGSRAIGAKPKTASGGLVEGVDVQQHPSFGDSFDVLMTFGEALEWERARRIKFRAELEAVEAAVARDKPVIRERDAAKRAEEAAEKAAYRARQDEDLAKRKAEDAARKAYAQEWIANHGSETLRMRVAGGYEYFGLLKRELATHVLTLAGLPVEEIEQGYEDERREKPNLDELRYEKQVREVLEKASGPDLVKFSTQIRTAAYEDDFGDVTRVPYLEIEMDLPHGIEFVFDMPIPRTSENGMCQVCRARYSVEDGFCRTCKSWLDNHKS